MTRTETRTNTSNMKVNTIPVMFILQTVPIISAIFAAWIIQFPIGFPVNLREQMSHGSRQNLIGKTCIALARVNENLKTCRFNLV